MRKHMMLLNTLATRRRHRCHNKREEITQKHTIKYSIAEASKQTKIKHNFRSEREYIVCPGELHTYLDDIIFKYIEKEH